MAGYLFRFFYYVLEDFAKPCQMSSRTAIRDLHAVIQFLKYDHNLLPMLSSGFAVPSVSYKGTLIQTWRPKIQPFSVLP